MKYKEQGHYISEKGRFAESAFKFCIEKYFPRSVFNPVSGDEHGFDGNLILQSDASKQNVISIYFQIKHTSKSNSKKRISTAIKNIETLKERAFNISNKFKALFQLKSLHKYWKVNNTIY
jgi:DNA-directed RNA polymerase subunit L